MERELSYDLHIHSCLSPCGDDDMTPGNIVGMAGIKGLDVIAVTDHNSCRNCPAVLKLAEQYGVLAIPGMELTTSEEVQRSACFPSFPRQWNLTGLSTKTDEISKPGRNLRKAADHERGRYLHRHRVQFAHQ